MKTKLIMLAAVFVMIFSRGLAQDNTAGGKTNAAASQSENIKKAPEEVKNIISAFFDKLIKNDIDNAFKFLLNNSIINENQDQVKELVEQTRVSTKVYGSMSGYEPYAAENVSASVIRLKYLALHRDLPIRWIFTYYKSPSNGWLIINVKFDDDTEEIFSGR